MDEDENLLTRISLLIKVLLGNSMSQCHASIMKDSCQRATNPARACLSRTTALTLMTCNILYITLLEDAPHWDARDACKVWQLALTFGTGVALHRALADTNLTYSCLTPRDAGVGIDTSLQLDPRKNKMPEKEPVVPQNADNDKVKECLPPLNTIALIPIIPSCLCFHVFI